MIIGIIVGAVVLAALLTAAFSVKIVREYQRIMLFRLGRALGTRGRDLSSSIRSPTERASSISVRHTSRFLDKRRSRRTTQRSRSTSSSSTR